MTDGALEDLRAALAAALREAERVDPADDTAALVFVTGLHRGLADLPALLGLARRLVDAAGLGAVSHERLTGRIAELDGLREALNAEHRILADLRPVLAGLKSAAAEREQVAAELAELRRWEALAGELPALRAQRTALADRRAELEAAGALEGDLHTEAAGLIRLGEERLALLAPHVADAVRRADLADRDLTEAGKRLAGEQARLAALTTELDGHRAAFEALREQAEQRVPFLDRYRRADADLAEALGRAPLAKDSGHDRARSALADVEARLTEIDALLRAALRTHDELHTELRTELGLV